MVTSNGNVLQWSFTKKVLKTSHHMRERVPVLFWPLDSKFRLDMSFSFIFVFILVISYIQCDNHNKHLHELKQFAEFSSVPIQLFFETILLIYQNFQ